MARNKNNTAQAFRQNNKAFTIDTNTFTNVDGYITAAAWYRPKAVLKNGERWVSTKADDMRPLLMCWHPTLELTVDYLNFMSENGLIAAYKRFELSDGPITLTNAKNAVQAELERQLPIRGMQWLNDLITSFVKTQDAWNIRSEYPGYDHLQKGALLFNNDKRTPNANSDYRILNRTPKNPTGALHDGQDKGGFELLLANDVDNSNPIVQSEQLNWLYYLLNIGTLLANNDRANFDGIRIDAVDNVCVDLLTIASDLFRDMFGSGSSDYETNKHLSILENWGADDPKYVDGIGNPQLTMDSHVQQQIKYSLTVPVEKRAKGPMRRFIEWGMPQRVNSPIGKPAQPNYSFIRAHDSEVQTVIGDIIDWLYDDADRNAPTPEQVAMAFKIYNDDQKLPVKRWTQHNIPSGHAILLTNKDTVPRVYYGDMFTDNGHFMETKSPYYTSIAALLRARRQFVGGGQTMAVNDEDILTSVRFGDNVSTANDVVSESRNQGIAVVVHNDPNKVPTNDIRINMGKTHGSQTYRALMTTTKEGLQVFWSDDNAPVHHTTEDGYLTIRASEMVGRSFAEVSGYVSVWVPASVELVTKPLPKTGSKEKNTKGDFFHSNAELDKNVIFEAFSNFQSKPETREQMTNVILAQKANTLVSWGITSLQIAPQYRNSGDVSFLDSVFANGYAFKDRYDLGANNVPTKYGTQSDLLKLIETMHENGIQVMADFVPDQLYNLPQQEIVNVTRVDATGKKRPDSLMENVLYAAYSKGSGNDQQAKFGGAYLEQLKKDFPAIFERKQLATGVPIDGDTKIKQWSAKYLNGSNIQGLGISFVLSDKNGNYFNVSDEANVPEELI